MQDMVLVTGISGFLGGHIAVALLKRGYRVRGSLRNKGNCEKVRQTLASAGADTSLLEFAELELQSDRGWTAAAEGCTYVQHVASPFVLKMPKHRDDLIRPAVDGTRRAISAALAAKVQKVVLTSSMAAIDTGHADYSRPFTDKDWTDLSAPHISAYVESKTRAEQLAWKMMDSAGAHDRLSVVNPAAIVGPLLDEDPGTTAGLIVRLLKGDMPVTPRVILEYVDVRDVAEVHIAAMENPNAGGHRYIVSDASLSLMEVADQLRAAFPAFAKTLPRRELPNWLVKALSPFDASLRESAPFVGIRKKSDSSPARALIGREFIDARSSLVITGASVIERHLV